MSGARDEIKAQLQAEFPGWQIWYVPGMNRTTTWCARPNPLLHAHSPEHLREYITQAHTDAAEDHPALAGLGDYRKSIEHQAEVAARLMTEKLEGKYT
jgi:hypothetical protein